MESAERLKHKVLQEKRLANRLGWAQTRLEAAERERIWAMAKPSKGNASAHAQGLSIRKISTATTLSSSRVHQLLHTDEADQIPKWLTHSAQKNALLKGQQALPIAALSRAIGNARWLMKWNALEWPICEMGQFSTDRPGMER